MNSNFYKIEREAHIDEIMEQNPYKLIVLIFSVESNFEIPALNNTFEINKHIKHNLNEDFDSIFLFINLAKYAIKTNKYSQYITKNSLPYTSFHFNTNLLARITSTEKDVFISTYDKIKEQIKEHIELVKKKKEENNLGTNDDKNKNEETNEVNELNKESNSDKSKDMENLTSHIRQQRKLEEIEKLKQQYLINELTKLKKAKEIQEQMESSD